MTSSKPNISSLPLRLHQTTSHLTAILSTSAGIDATLATVCYTALFVHSRRPTPALKALYDALEDHRIFLRLFGLFPLYTTSTSAWLEPHRDPVVKTLLYASLAAGTAFQVLENVALLAQKGVLRGKRVREWEGWCWIVSNKFWLAQLIFEGGRLARVGQLRWREELGAEEVKSCEGEDDWKGGGPSLRSESMELKTKWLREVYVTAASIPLAVHWSSEEDRSPISETLFAGSGLISGVAALRDIWDETVS